MKIQGKTAGKAGSISSLCQEVGYVEARLKIRTKPHVSNPVERMLRSPAVQVVKADKTIRTNKQAAENKTIPR